LGEVGAVSKLFNAFGTAFAVIGFFCPPAAALVSSTVYIFVRQGQELRSIVTGLLVFVIAAIVIGLLYERKYQLASEVYPEQYRNVLQRLRTSRTRLEVCKPRARTELVTAAQADARGLVGDLERLLKDKAGSKWISATGYLEAWSDINRLEEQLIFLVPPPQVVSMAHDDLLRLQGSEIPQAANLHSRLKTDLNRFTGGNGTRGWWHRRPAGNEQSARADMVLVRQAINRWREDQRAKLVGARDLTMLAAAIAGLIAYGGLLSVVVSHPKPEALKGAVLFVITGALISLLHQLTVVGLSDSAVEDFGQATARLLAATLVSGLIAPVGIIVLQGMNLTVNGISLTPTFDVTKNKSGFFWAAAFGLAPSFLFQLLQARIDIIKTSLASSNATGGAAK
jgi:hypothetical protein